MYTGLIDALSFMYGYLCRARGKLSRREMGEIAAGAHAMAGNAQAVLGTDKIERADDRADLATAAKIDDHIEEMYQFLAHLEIC